MRKSIFYGLLIIVLLFSVIDVSAMANCALKSFTNACSKCPFNAEGGVDQKCQDKYQNEGKACMGIAYPIASAKFFMGMCPALQACVDTLQACSNMICTGKARQNCANPVCSTCYTDADRCAVRASADCDQEEACGNGKCVKDKGETQESCCSDCGCPGDLVCKVSECVEKSAAEAPSGIASPPNDSLSDDLLDFAFDNGCIPFVLLPIVGMGIIVGIPTGARKS